MRFGLKEETIEAIKNCLEKFPTIEGAILYGSRAKGNYKSGSDIDTTLKGESLTLPEVFKLENTIDDLLLPYKFDISIFHQISNPDLLDHINRVGQLIYSKNKAFKDA
jgi:predicted nucleotidyltransferase